MSFPSETWLYRYLVTYSNLIFVQLGQHLPTYFSSVNRMHKFLRAINKFCTRTLRLLRTWKPRIFRGYMDNNVKKSFWKNYYLSVPATVPDVPKSKPKYSCHKRLLLLFRLVPLSLQPILSISAAFNGLVVRAGPGFESRYKQKFSVFSTDVITAVYSASASYRYRYRISHS